MTRKRSWIARWLALAVVTATFGAGAAIATVTPVGAAGTTISGKRLSLTFDATDPEHVVDVEWKNSANMSSGNLVAEGGPVTCGDPSEFFGEAFGAPEGTPPYPVFAGHVATGKFSGHQATMTGATADCAERPVVKVKTSYQILSGDSANAVQITRSFGFTKSSGLQGDPANGYVGLRAYVPRLSDTTYTQVIYPNGTDTGVTNVDVSGCPFDCFTSVGPTWSGHWLADIDPVSGNALIIDRDPSMTAPVEMTVNYDGYSSSVLASFVLVQPKKGWKHTVSETETLCFADLTIWPQSERDAGQLPSGCGQ